MKAKDIALIVVAVILGIIFSEVINNLVFVKSNSGQQVDVVPSISSKFPTVDSRYFNSSSIDPTLFIKIGNNQNSNPFLSSTNSNN